MPFVAHIDSDAPPTGGPDRWYVVADGELLVTEALTVPAGPAFDAGGVGEQDVEPVYLGELDGTGCWAIGVAGLPGTPPAAPEGMRWIGLRELGSHVETEEWHLAGRAVQLVEWARTSRYCGRCGSPTAPSPRERALRCPVCELRLYPVIAPAVIVLVQRGNEVLLGRNGRFRGRTHSVFAGFVEPGETFEEAVRREVLEEVGVQLGEVTYVASQPWPFPHSLMVGFRAEWAGGDVRPDGDEIIEAGWFTPDSLPDLPPPLSIARRLIEDWRRDVAGG